MDDLRRLASSRRNRYSDLGSFSPTFFEGTQNDVFTNIHVVTQEATFGIGYKF